MTYSKIKQMTYVLCAALFALAMIFPAHAQLDLGINAESAVLVEQSTGRVLYQQAPDEKLPPASVTKIMTMLLVCEAIQSGKVSLDDEVITSAHAASMGGSQVFLEEGERMTVRDLFKAVAVASGNDAAVALGEHISGTEEAFVAKMNSRARELGMQNTHFENCNGLDAPGHVTSAADIAIMSRELLKHSMVTEYTGIWMDTLRGGEFGISNTNRLIRFYKGANGLKTGSTGNAKYCISASALRDGMQLIAVVMGSPTSDDRFTAAKKLMDYGFSNYTLAEVTPERINPIEVRSGTQTTAELYCAPFKTLVPKGSEDKITQQIELAEHTKAPVEAGQKVGVVRYYLGEEEIGSCDILTLQAVERISIWGIFTKMLAKFSF